VTKILGSQRKEELAICADILEVFLMQRSPGVPFVNAKEQVKNIFTSRAGLLRLLRGIRSG
jgi:hypothetical protein